MDEIEDLPPGIRRTVRAATVGSMDEEAAHLPVQTAGPSSGTARAADGGGPPPSPRPSNPTVVLPAKNNPAAARLRRVETYDSITTSIGEEDMESYNGGESTPATTHGGYTVYSVQRFRRKLRFFFMNPYEKWKAKRKFPWKLVLQLIKVVLATVQLTSFGFSRSSHVNFLEKSNIAFKHLYLKNWNPSFETLPYPPATGAFAIYTIPDFYETINYALYQYNRTEELAIGTFRFSREDEKDDPVLCNTHYKIGAIYKNATYKFDTTHFETCTRLVPVMAPNGTEVYDVEELLRQNGTSINFDSVIRLTLKLTLKTIHLKTLDKHDRPDCYKFKIDTVFENQQHDGQMLITMDAYELPFQCRGSVAYATNEEAVKIAGSVFDSAVIVICLTSLVLCVRSIYRAQKLRRETTKFFIRQYDYKLTFSEQMEFVDLWYLLIIINDILTTIGSVVKILIENKASNSYELCGTTLGTASLLVWFGVLRYLGFFEKYNVLILTLKKSAPNVLRFLLCAVVFYLGFAFCGWVVLGPFHMKFREISTASECLFSLVNGDDMFVTFSIIGNRMNNYVWFYSRVYLYLFISLFIYVVLSVFISVIMDAYETIKYYYEHGFPMSNLMKFVSECPDDPSSPLYRSDDHPSIHREPGLLSRLNCFGKFNCCGNRDNLEDEASHIPDERTRLITT